MGGYSVYTCAVLLGAPDRLASLIQLEKTAVFLAATVLAAPHSGPYDGTLLAIAVAFWLMARSAPLPLWCWTLASMIWLFPMLSRPCCFP
ncbi:hypothetical protein [Bradyrhizobium sp. BWA-3-5]|uniref:hypothetical protein n=1 Tax=Bradyrhizobium sp. BWA-3-5 TaxID=3080013 RepID=UPI00293EDABB|nr:hypothetical protein [Bradyrhizobium sp. BWA-3-5]WOH66690.1 hypothetical protein RX331_02540 [Bradyrhizobium sp. BWA-3-5]